MKHLLSILVLCLLLTACGKKEAPAGAPPPPVICETPIYEVEIYKYMGGILSGPLYIATMDAPESVLETGERIPGEQSTPICWFSTVGDTEGVRNSVGTQFLLLDLYDGGIFKSYSVRAGSNSYSSSTNIACYLNSLAKKTGEDMPLYLVSSGGFRYAVIGDTAYCLGPWAPELVPEALPELYFGDESVKVIKIE